MEIEKFIIKWLGGAGFLLKFIGGVKVCIDPYLSDSVERIAGFKRLIPAPMKADEIEFDLLLISHSHPDHLDEDSFDLMIESNPGCKVIASPDCESFLNKKSVDYMITKPGDTHLFMNLSIKTMPADHVELCPEAVSYIINSGKRRIYFTGDTSLNENIMAEAIGTGPEILIPCINGAYGNMTEKEAAYLAKICGSQIVIPCHYGLFAEHNGDLSKFLNFMKDISPLSQVCVIPAGKEIQI